MIRKTRHATTNYKRLKPFISAIDSNDGYLKCTSEGYMDLSFDSLGYSDCYGNPVYSIAHNSIQNGDLMADPDMTFSVNHETGTIIPMSFQNDFMSIYQEVFRTINGRQMYSNRLLTDLDEFLYQWLNNIEMQGFKPV